MVIDAVGRLYSTDANLCLYCGSTEHEHFACNNPGKDAIKNALNVIRECMMEKMEATADSPMDDADMPGSHADTQADGGVISDDEEDDPMEGNMHDVPMYMSEVGDRDELGQFCIAGQRVDEGGPTTRSQFDAVVREALMQGGRDQWTVQEFYKNYSKLNQGKEMHEEIRHYMGGFFRIVPTNVSAFHTGLHGFYGVDYGRDFVPSMDAYDRAMSWNLNTALLHHAGKKGSHTGFGLKCDEAGWVRIDALLRYDHVWNHITHRPIEKLYWYNYVARREEIDTDVARFRLSTLFKIMRHNVVDGRRVRVQVLAFGIMHDVDLKAPYIERSGATANTVIPADGLLLEPIAVRAPSGHTHTNNWCEVKLRTGFLSHPLTPGAATMMPSSFHVTSRENLFGIFEEWRNRENGNFLQCVRTWGP